jgi:hypothetical protein
MTGHESDETSAYVLLAGFVARDKKGLPQTSYLKPDSEEELAARAALARLLRRPYPLTEELRKQLAALFDPEPDTHPAIERKISFRHRGRGRRPQHMRNTQIALRVWDRSDGGQPRKVEKAVQHAADEYGLTRDEVYKIWGPYKTLLKAINEPVSTAEV